MIVLFGLPCSVLAQTSDLEERVRLYWNAVLSGDRTAAQAFIEPESRGLYSRLPFPVVKSWSIETTEAISEEHSRVFLEVDWLLQVGQPAYRFPVVQGWTLLQGEWYLLLPQLSSAAASRTFLGLDTNPRTGGEFSVLPETLYLHFLNPVQRGVFEVCSPLDTGVSINAVGYDGGLFRLLSSPPEVKAGECGKLVVEYAGDQEEKDLTSEILIEAEIGNKSEKVRLQIVYNHISPAARVFFGLSEEDAAQLKRRDRPQPVLKRIQ